MIKADKPTPAPPLSPPLANDVVPAVPAVARLSPGVLLWQKPSLILFLALFAVNEALLFLKVTALGWEAAFLGAAVLCAVVSLARRLPLQNVLTAGVLILCVTGVFVSIGAVTGVPFGPILYNPELGPRLFDAAPWSLLLLWVVVVIHGRGVARLFMRPWRKTNYYGYWVMGWTGLLAVHFDLALEPFATEVRNYWLWQPTLTLIQWHGAPWVNFLGWFMTTLAVLCCTLPWLINKQPVKRAMDYHPLLCWMALHVWLATGNALHGTWDAVVVSALGCAATCVFAVRGARW